MTINLPFIALAMATVAAQVQAQAGAAAQNRNGNAVAAEERKYCIQYEKMVGSRLERQECKTKRQWVKEGVDVDKLLKK